LPAGAQDDVEDHLGGEGVEGGLVRGQLAAVALDLLDAFGQLSGVRAPVEDGDLVAARHQRADDVRSDEPGRADDKNLNW
jgi:hypothetical protein